MQGQIQRKRPIFSQRSPLNSSVNQQSSIQINQTAILPQPKLSLFATFYICLFLTHLKRRRKATRHRKFILEEWLTTQKSYYDNLEAALDHIKRPMMEKGIIAKKEANILFSEFEAMKGLSQEMIRAVSIIRNERNPNKTKVGANINKFAPFYKIYSNYYSCRMKSEKLLNELAAKQPDLLREVEDELQGHFKEKDPRKANITIHDCLEQPQYRMFKYDLLLKDFLRKLPCDHEDRKAVQTAVTTFRALNQANNEQMQKNQGLQKKAKLDRLFGKSIETVSQYIIEMQAQTLNFPSKLYIFNNLVIVSILPTSLGLGQEERYGNLYLTATSFICLKLKMKYFQNGLLLCGQDTAMHFYLSDLGTRFEIYNILCKVIKELQKREMIKRTQRAVLEEVGIKFTMAAKQNQKALFFSHFRIQVLTVEVRPLGITTNDTAYLTRFMVPNWIEDTIQVEGKFAVETQGRHPKQQLNQIVEIHLSQLMAFINQLRRIFPAIKFPEIDPFSKDFNLYTQSKRSTKSYQVRSILLQEFLNFIFRHPSIAENKSVLADAFRLIPALWDYTCGKNSFFQSQTEQARNLQSVMQKSYRFGYEHCEQCHKANVSTLEQFQSLRNEAIQNDRECFNKLNLARLTFLRLPKQSLKSLSSLMLYNDYSRGRIDYAFSPKETKFSYNLTIFLNKPSQKEFVNISCGETTKIGDVMIGLGRLFNILNMMDFRLELQYSGYTRLLDQDQFVIDLIRRHDLQYSILQGVDSNSTLLAKEEGLLAIFKQALFSNVHENRLVLKKMIYLTRQIEVNAMELSEMRAELTAHDLFCKLKSRQLNLSLEHWGVVVGCYALLQGQNKPNQTAGGTLIPLERMSLLLNRTFVNFFEQAIRCKTSKRETIMKCAKVMLQYPIRFMVEVEVHTIPMEVLLNTNLRVVSNCFLGVSYKELVVLQTKENLPAVQLCIDEVETVVTQFSIFFQYSSFLRSTAKKNNFGKEEMRFEGKMLFGFKSILNIYKLIRENLSSVL